MLWGGLSLCAVLAVACPGPPIQQYAPPGVFDSRSPCPMLNTLANHNYLPHNGLNISAPMIADAFTKALNVDPTLAQSAVLFADNFGKDVFTLEDLYDPNIIQHVASITRDDDSERIDLLRIEAFMADSSSSSVTVDSIAKTRLRLNAESAPRNFSNLQTTASLSEAGMILMFLTNDPPAANAPLSEFQGPKDRLWTFLTQERFPIEFGWRPSKRTILVDDLLYVMQGIVDSMDKQSGKA
ncbi:Peroxidase stcC-like protein [Cladobotryum mycophilum]|uniref:Peroxidase stcC-like protein n=1 Tax=Cladobotryum mycophilum TaxID=491253 RepID=A0ABR0SQM4_9HYPO